MLKSTCSWLSVALCALGLGANAARAGVVNGTLTADVYIKQENPNNSYGIHPVALAGLLPAKSGAHLPIRTLIKFDVGILPDGVSIVSATLRLNSEGIYDESTEEDRELVVSRLSSDFNEGNNTSAGVTWATQPGVVGAQAGPFVVGVEAGEWLELDVTQQVADSTAAGDQFVGLRVAAADENEDLFKVFTFFTKEAANPSLAPQLVIEYSDSASPATLASHLLFVDHLGGTSRVIRGGVTSTEPLVSIQVTNNATGQSAGATADDLGAFSVPITANVGDTILVVATDGSGNQSGTQSIVVPTVTTPSIFTPTNGASLTSTEVMVVGFASSPSNSGIMVNGKRALFNPATNIYVLPNLLLATGANDIEVSGVSQDGHFGTLQITVNSNGAEPVVSVMPKAQSGTTPFDAEFEYKFAPTANPVSIAVDFDNDGTDDFVTTTLDGMLSNTYSSDGVFVVRLTMTDDQGATAEALTAVEVFSPATVTVVVSNLWSELNTRLMAGDVSNALRLLTPAAQRKYQPVFNTLLGSFPTIVATYSAPQEHIAGGSYAEIGITRSVDGQDRVFLIGFVKGEDGVWHIATL